MATPERPLPASEASPISQDATQRPQAEASTHSVAGTPAPAAPATLAPGALLGPYRLMEKLGEGGMGAVYKAQHEHLDMTVAVKVLPPHFTAHAAAVARFKREMKAVGKLKHPHIVQAHDAGEIGGVHYLAMEYVDGIDLNQRVQSKGPLSVTNACKAVRQAALALAAAHEAGLVHRDIKPSNLLVAKDGQLKLLDLGLARLANEADPAHGVTTAGQTFGTPDYMAPEQWDDAHAVDGRCDLYALGCTLFFLLTGRAPYRDHASLMQKMKAHGTLPPPDLRAALHSAASPSKADGPSDPNENTVTLPQVRAIPDALVAIYEKLLAKRPEDRFASAKELVAALDDVLASVKTQTAPPTSHPEDVFPTLVTGEMPRGLRRRKRPAFPVSRIALASILGAAVLFAGIIIVIKKRDGTTVKIPVDPGDKVEIVTDDKVEAPVTPPLKPSTPDHGYALEFDGQSSYVEIPSLTFAELLKANPRQPVTIEAVVSSHSALSATGHRTIVTRHPLRLVDDRRTGDRYGFWATDVQDQHGATGSYSAYCPWQIRQTVHLAAVYDGQTFRLFRDGKLPPNQKTDWIGKDNQYRDATGEAFALTSPYTSAWTFLGAGYYGPNDFRNFFHGVIDEVRISKSARYTQDFTPPARFEADADTLALYHFDEGQGDVLTDSSGNGHHGKIVNAKWVPGLTCAAASTATSDHALDFDGQSSYVEIPTLSLAELKTDPRHPITVEAFVSAKSAVTTNGARYVVSRSPLGLLQAFRNSEDECALNFQAVGTETFGSRYTTGYSRVNQVVHIAGVYDGKTLHFFVGGQNSQKGLWTIADGKPRSAPEAEFSLSPDYAASGSTLLGANLRGGEGGLRMANFFHGAIDEVRISKSARYSQDFTPPVRFEPDADTLALYHFDEGAGDVLSDASGNGHHGKIVKAKWVPGLKPGAPAAGATGGSSGPPVSSAAPTAPPSEKSTGEPKPSPVAPVTSKPAAEPKTIRVGPEPGMVATLKEALADANGGDTIEIATDEPLTITEPLKWSKPGPLTIRAAEGKRPILVAAHKGGTNSSALRFEPGVGSGKDDVVTLNGLTFFENSGVERTFIGALRSLSLSDAVCVSTPPSVSVGAISEAGELTLERCYFWRSAQAGTYRVLLNLRLPELTVRDCLFAGDGWIHLDKSRMQAVTSERTTFCGTYNGWQFATEMIETMNVKQNLFAGLNHVVLWPREHVQSTPPTPTELAALRRRLPQYLGEQNAFYQCQRLCFQLSQKVENDLAAWQSFTDNGEKNPQFVDPQFVRPEVVELVKTKLLPPQAFALKATSPIRKMKIGCDVTQLPDLPPRLYELLPAEMRPDIKP